MDVEEVEIPCIHGPSGNRRRGRPKKEDAPLRQLSIRLVPCDGEDVEFERHILSEDFTKFIAGREISEKDKLHYHIFAETRRSDTYLKTLFYRMARWTPHHPKGNPVFSCKDAHSNTQGYLVKDEDVAYTIGFTPQELEALVERSEQYRRDLEANKKRRTRKSQDTMKQFVEEAIEHARLLLQNDPYTIVDGRVVVKFLLERYQQSGKSFPSRSQMENAVMRVMYQFSPNNVVDYYCRHMNV